MNRRLNDGCYAILFFTAVSVSQAQTLTTLVNFKGTNGALPQFVSLVQGVDGDLYGTTEYGYSGDGLCAPKGCGTIFKITPGGQLTTLHYFDWSDGALPEAGLVQATNGDFYGTTSGGASDYGTVFKITPSGTLTTVYTFTSGTDGGIPTAPLIQAASGDLFGTTQGTVFEITPGGTLTTLYKVGWPASGVIQGIDGDFYGTTEYGGARLGSIFKIHPEGIHTTLYTFCQGGVSCPDGALPLAGLLQATDGEFYGTTTEGGGDCETSQQGNGTIFKITSAGTLTTLYSFCSQPGNGDLPSATLIQATDGNFYGTTRYGGSGFGTIFRFTPNGTLTTLHRFTSSDGGIPAGGLLQATNGSFYGTASAYGAAGGGTVYKLDVGLDPFIKTLPASAKVGQDIKILGTNLTGATSVTFNGVAADFTVSPAGTAISTTVPAGATTGKVQVITPGGTLLSSIDFRVAP